jgi:hypothetical protein
MITIDQIRGIILKFKTLKANLLKTNAVEVESTSSAYIDIKADTDDITETDLPYIRLYSDGDTKRGAMGVSGPADFTPDGEAFSGVKANAHIIWNTTNDMQIINDDDIYLTAENGIIVHETPYVIHPDGRLCLRDDDRETASNVAMQIVGSSYARSLFRSERYSTDTFASGMEFLKARGESDSPSAINSGDYLMYMDCYGYNGSGWSPVTEIATVATENFTGSNGGGEMQFIVTENGTTSPFLAMKIENDGTVNIVKNASINGEATGTAIKDEDEMTSNSDTHLVTQQSVKAYVDNVKYVEFYAFENTTATTFDDADDWHALNLPSGSVGQIDGWTVAGYLGGTFTAVSDAGGGEVTISATAHGMSEGDTVVLTDSNYNDVYVVQSVNTNDFNIIATFGATDTGNWARPAQGKINAGSAGIYDYDSNSSISASSNSQTFEFAVFVNAVLQENIAVRGELKDAGKWQSIVSNGLIDLDEGDILTVLCKNVGSTSNMTIRHSNTSLTRVKRN